MAPAARLGSKPGRIGHVVSTLGRDIASGVFPAGAVLPAEPDLERHYGVSRGVVREAVKVLAGKGLVSVGPRIGTRVRPKQAWSLLDHDVLGWLGRDGFDHDLMLALDETRRIIEPAAAALAAERAGPEDVLSIRRAYEDMATYHGDIARATEADKAFHLAILDATGNPVLASFRTAIDAILSAVFEATVPMLLPNLPNHEAVAAAIERRDAVAARAAMERVLDRTRCLIEGDRDASASIPALQGRAESTRSIEPGRGKPGCGVATPRSAGAGSPSPAGEGSGAARLFSTA